MSIGFTTSRCIGQFLPDFLPNGSLGDTRQRGSARNIFIGLRRWPEIPPDPVFQGTRPILRRLRTHPVPSKKLAGEILNSNFWSVRPAPIHLGRVRSTALSHQITCSVMQPRRSISYSMLSIGGRE
jgi:hypothetical protein